jgi:hypothetical protein
MGKKLTHLADPAFWEFNPDDLLQRCNAPRTCCGQDSTRRWVSQFWRGQTSCTRCVAKYPVTAWRAGEAMINLSNALRWLHTLGTYCRCRVCNQKVDDQKFWWAVRQAQPQLCSSECLATETKQRYACCMEATPSPCVCAYSFDCQTHGQTHVGTHD